MPITWFSTPKPAEPEYRLVGTAIIITPSGLETLKVINPAFGDAKSVRLGWDPDRRMIAIVPDAGKDAFKLARRGRGDNRTIQAAKLVDEFAIDGQAGQGEIIQEGNVALIPIAGVQEVRRRGRKPKAA